MPSEQPECVFEMGVEGGGVQFFRQWTADDAWCYTFKGLSGGFDRADFDEDWTPPPPRPPQIFMTLDDAIAGFSSDGDWVHWYPTRVHPDFKEHVWLLRERTIASFEKGRDPSARRDDTRWARICGRRLPKSPARENAKPSRIIVRPGGTLDMVLGCAIATIEHLRKAPMSDEEISEFEANMVRVLEARKAEQRERTRKLRATRSVDTSGSRET